MIKIDVEFSDFKKWTNFSRYIQNNLLYGEMQAAMVDVADNTVFYMREIISSSKKRHSLGNNLENSIDKEILNTVAGIDIGIGRVSLLKSDAPYYEVLNSGGYIPYSTSKGAPLGTFEGDAPDSNIVSGNQNWERSGSRGFFMKPKSPIEGIDYIGKGIRNLDKELIKTVTSLGEEFINKIQNNL